MPPPRFTVLPVYRE